MRSDVRIVRVRDCPQRFTHFVSADSSKLTLGARRIVKDFMPSLATKFAIESFTKKAHIGCVQMPDATPVAITPRLSDCSYAGTRSFNCSMALDSWATRSTKKARPEDRRERAPRVVLQKQVAKFPKASPTVVCVNPAAPRVTGSARRAAARMANG